MNVASEGLENQDVLGFQTKDNEHSISNDRSKAIFRIRSPGTAMTCMEEMINNILGRMKKLSV